MKAVVIGANGVEIADVEKPTPGSHQVLVHVRANALNRADLIMSSGHMHGSRGGLGAVLGLECAGEVAGVGSEVTGFRIGDRVMCSGGSNFAEYAVADIGRVAHIPGNNMTFNQATTLPVALATMHDALITNGRLKAGETVLIQGASTGVGLMGMQIAKMMGARVVIGSSTNAGRRARLTEFGADVAVDSSDPGWVDAVMKATGGKGVDLIVDQLSASVANANIKAAALKGRIVNVGRLGGNKGEFDFDLHALKRIDYIGVTFRTRTVEEVREINRLVKQDLWPAVEAGKLSLPIDSSYPFAQAAQAFAHMKANAHFGKIVLTH
jgi:NADPH:quinone reductase